VIASTFESALSIKASETITAHESLWNDNGATPRAAQAIPWSAIRAIRIAVTPLRLGKIRHRAQSWSKSVFTSSMVVSVWSFE
jgi:hypothetical protein